MSSGIRRSTRTRTANQRYVNNDWDTDILQLIESSNEESDNKQESVEPENDTDFAENQNASPVDDVDLEPNADLPGSASAQGEEEEEDEDEGEDDVKERAPIVIAATPAISSRILEIKHKRSRKVPNMHSRGLLQIDRKLARTLMFRGSFGPSVSEMDAILQTRSRWNFRARDVTFPSRSTLRECLAEDWQRQELSDDDSQTRSVMNFDQQKVELVSLSDLEQKQLFSDGPTQQVVLGPNDQQKVYEIRHLGCLDYGIAWEQKNGNDVASVADTDDSGLNRSGAVSSKKRAAKPHKKTRFHEGWLLNAGERIQSMAWKSCSKAGTSHLAVACRTRLSEKGDGLSATENKAAAFTRTSNYPSYIQIWRFYTSEARENDIESLDFAQRPILCCVITAEFGGIRQLEWIGHESPVELSEGCQRCEPLAILSTDGCVRVINVEKMLSNENETLVWRLESAGCCIKPPDDTLFTAFTLASRSDIIIGASDGMVRLYNLGQCLTSEPKPYLSLPLHHTYIMSLATAGKKELSHFLASVSAAGDSRLTDLRSPYQDTLTVPKTRLPTSNLAYCPLTQSFVTTVDHSGRTDIQSARTILVCHQLRHFYSQVMINKFPNNTGTASGLAASNFHPFVLAGNTQGTVFCQNILRKLIPRSGGYVQNLWKYEWMPLAESKDDDNADGTAGSAKESTPQSLFHGRDVRPGISRFHEGFNIEKSELGFSRPTKPGSKKKKGPKAKAKRNADGLNTASGEDNEDVVDNEDEIDDAEADVDEMEIDIDDDPNQDNEDIDMHTSTDVIDSTKRKSKKAKTSSSSLSTNVQSANDEVVAEIVFEEEQSITSIVWNQDPRRSTWVAVGFGSGLIRVQDVSHED